MAFALWEYIFTFLQGWILQTVLPKEAMPASDYRFKRPLFSNGLCQTWSLDFLRHKDWQQKAFGYLEKSKYLGASEYLRHTLTGTEHISVPSSAPGRHQCLFTTVFYIIYNQYKFI